MITSYSMRVIAVGAVLATATSAFGGVSLTVNGCTDWCTVPFVNGQFSVTIGLTNDTPYGIAGIDVLPYTMDEDQNMLDLFRVTSRTLAPGSPFVWSVPPTNPDDKVNVPLDATVNYGLTYSDATNGTKYNGAIMTLTFVPAPGATFQGFDWEHPPELTMYMGYAFGAAHGGGDFAYPTVFVSPEPMTALLLVGGAALLARRRA